MFRCEKCEVIIGPRVKPVHVVVNTRAANYHNEYYVEDEYGNREKREIDSIGHEIVTELKICNACAEANGIQTEAGASGATVRSPKSKFEEKLAPPVPNTLANVMIHNAITRVNQKTKRSQDDSRIAIPIVKFFTDTNKNFEF